MQYVQYVPGMIAYAVYRLSMINHLCTRCFRVLMKVVWL